MNKTKLILWAASLVLAIALTISCSTESNGDDGSNGDSGSNVNGGNTTMYTLTVNASPSSAGTVSPAQASYASGTQATITATPVSGYAFSRWSGASTSTSNPLSITMNGDKSLTAVFEQTANAVIITLRYWESKETDGIFGSKLLDPRISFIVTSRQGGKTASTNKTGYLLDKDDLGQTWSGSSKSSPVPFITSADEVRIEAFVEEKDVLSNDDISPGYYVVFYPPFRISSGTETLDYGNGKSKVRFDYEFVWR